MCVHIYMYIHKHMRTHTEYIKKTMKSGHRAIYRLNIFFLFFFFFLHFACKYSHAVIAFVSWPVVHILQELLSECLDFLAPLTLH